MSTPPTKVLIVDDDPDICRLVEDVLARDGLVCTTVHTAHDAKRHLSRHHYDAAIVDLVLPDGGGIELLRFIAGRRISTCVVCMSGAAGPKERSAALQAGAMGFFQKPLDVFRLAEAVVRAVGDGSFRNLQIDVSDVPERMWNDDERLRRMILESCRALVHTVEAKDPHTRRHSEHVAFYSEQFARHVGLQADMIDAIRLAALLHDIGKISVPDAILTKPGSLTEEEFALIRRHPLVGSAILGNISALKLEAALVRFHHEAWDGTGYSTGLAGEEIPLGSRIINIADSIDAMLMQRTYKQAYPVGRVLDELRRCAGGQFDPSLAEAALDWCLHNRPKLIFPRRSGAEAESA